MAGEGIKVAYDESIRAIGQQSSNLDNLRSRAGTLIAAASLVTTFLGGQSLAKPVLSEGAASYQSLNGWALAALFAFVVTIIAALVCVYPWRWYFVTSASALIQQIDVHGAQDDAPQVQRELALRLEVNYDNNKSQLDRLWLAFRIGCLSLVAEIVLWLVFLRSGS